MYKIIIFAGTTEGRLLAEYCHSRKIPGWISVVSDYGKEVLPDSPFLKVHTGAMDKEEMEAFIKEKGALLVLDATHPYAREASKNIRHACEAARVTYYRVLRKTTEDAPVMEAASAAEEAISEADSVISVDSIEEAVEYLENTSGNILVTTGSKELAKYTRLSHWQKRIFARVLPTSSVLLTCEEMGFHGSRIIAMQGPFSVGFNSEMIKQHQIQYLVTKESGAAGGFQEKLMAAAECGIISVIIGRPVEEDGISLEKAMEYMEELADSQEDFTQQTDSSHKQNPVAQPSANRKIYLIGTGMGGYEQMTLESLHTLEQCDVIFGAKRMVEDVLQAIGDKTVFPYYRSEDILNWLDSHGNWKKAGVLYSGDTGFYSGARQMSAVLRQPSYDAAYEVKVLPGISSVSQLCAALGTSWEDVRLISLHGRQWNLIEEIKKYNRVFALLDGVNTVNSVCRLLLDHGLDHVRISVGERLSYADEKITTGFPKDLEEGRFDSLSAILIEREWED